MDKWKRKGRDLEWMLDHGFRLAGDGLMEISKREFSKLNYEQSILHPGKRTLKVPDDCGLELITEGIHFRVI